MTFRLYDTARRAVVDFLPGPVVTLYICGIQPYDAAHLGTAVTYLLYDVLERRLRDLGHVTQCVRSVHDIGDDVLRKARELGVNFLDLAAEERARVDADMNSLRLLPAWSEPSASSAIPDILGFIGMVLDSGHAYTSDGGVYFSVESFGRFGQISHLERAQMLRLATLQGGNPADPAKRDPLDFVLWQPSSPGEPAWESLWGLGRPGFHITCSALCMRELGTTIDLHGGSTELIFPHHECVAAQSEAVSGMTFVRHWLHAPTVLFGGTTMSQTLGNLVFIGDLLNDWDPMTVRLALLSHSYRDAWEWRTDLLQQADDRLALWRANGHGDGVLDDVRNALDDDLNIPVAISHIDDAAARGLPVSSAAGLLGIDFDTNQPRPTRDGLKWADRYETLGRGALRSTDYFLAKEHLRTAISLDPARAPKLGSEFAFLLESGVQSPADSVGDIVAWISNVWALFQSDNNFDFSRTKEEDEQSPETPPPEPPRDIVPSGEPRNPRVSGDRLELAVLEVLRLLFALEASTLTRLRRQQPGHQYGHDLEFDCTVSKFGRVKCHVECKNYHRPIRPADIADKLVQEQHLWRDRRIDHWILVSPHSNPSNELSHMLRSWDENRTWPFNVQIWSPENGIQELLALDPAAYSAVYMRPPIVGGALESDAILNRWQQRLMPRLTLAPAWDRYLSNPGAVCTETDDVAHFESLYRDYVTFRGADKNGRLLNVSLETAAMAWLRDLDVHGQPLLLLGDFGEGKSFFTYALARRLVKEFRLDPEHGWVPLRIPLRGLRAARDCRQLLQRRLEEIGSTVADWLDVTERYESIVLLDGFDEISTSLDVASISRNMQLIGDCVDMLSRSRSRILITSRRLFPESSQDHERLIDQIGATKVLYMAPLLREDRLAHLERFAEEVGLPEKLRRLSRLYDPIGLSAKALFLEMIKVTLPDLPETHFNELVLYRAYVEKSLRRKVSDLEDEYSRVAHRDLIGNLLRILQDVAVGLYLSGEGYVSLRSLDVSLAERLWRMSDQDAGALLNVGEADRDAGFRVGVRSLLRAVPAGPERVWAVDFFHRSMREYFLASAIVGSLRDDDGLAEELLRFAPLQPEVMNFVVLMVEEQPIDDLSRVLIRLARKAAVGVGAECLGGNALSLLKWCGVPLAGSEWSGLVLNYADLSGADLTGCTFRKCALVGVNLENANLTRADLRDADLSGARIEETAVATAIHAHDDGVVVGYDDRTLRLWQRGPAGRWGSTILPVKLTHRAACVFVAGGVLCIFGDSQFTAYSFENNGARMLTSFNVVPAVLSIATVEAKLFVQVAGGQHAARHFMITVEGRVITNIGGIGGRGAAAMVNRTLLVRPTIEGDLVMVGLSDRGEEESVRTIGPVCTVATTGKHGWELFAMGGTDGSVTVYRVDRSHLAGAPIEVAALRMHNRRVTALTFVGDDVLASGGADRTVVVWRFRSPQNEDASEALRVMLQCPGIRLDGARGTREVELLRLYASRQ